jgi:signal transduction histidine kinase
MIDRPSHILIVDDDETARYIKSHLLERQGYALSEASLGREALAMAAADCPDLVLLDVKLPDVNGIEVCREIKSRFPQMIVLQTSAAFTGLADRTRALEGGADSYLVEPIEPDELVATVNALLRMQKAEQEVRRINRNLEEIVAERTRELAETNRRLVKESADRLKAEMALWHTQKLELIGQLTGGIAHDFNNLLTVISGNLELIHETFDSGAKLSSARLARLRQLLVTAEAAAESAAKITQQLLAFARHSAFTAEPTSPADLLRTARDFLKRAAGEAMDFACAWAPDLWHCRVDPAQLEAAILNLVVNARDAMPEGGRLSVEAANVSIGATGGAAERDVPAGDFVRIVVSDTGHGMMAEVADRVFEPFFTTKDAGKGSGLGLSQVYGFVKQSGGHVVIDTTPGEGTAFRLYLPRSPVSGGPSEPASAHPPASPAGGETVLIVEDNETVREVAAVMLDSLGYKVLNGADGTEALALIRGPRHIDLLVSDIVMSGGVDGFELARRARALRPGLPILLVSGYPSGAGSATACEFPILRKPYRREELAHHIRAALGDPVAVA